MSKLLAMMMNKKYTRLEYIESTGTQWINTEITASQDLRVKTKIYSKSTNNQSVFCSRSSQGSNNFALLLVNGYFRPCYDTEYSNSNKTFSINTLYDIDFNKNNFYVDGELIKTFTYNTFSNDISMRIANSINAGEIYYIGRIYPIQIYKNDILVCDLIPVIRNSDNEIGMLDRVSGIFRTNRGTGKFRVPNEVGYTVVGTPTIVDGVVSGFSYTSYNSGNYLQINNGQIDFSTDNFKIKVCASKINTVSTQETLIATTYSYPIGIYVFSDRVELRLYTSNNTLIQKPIEYDIPSNTKFYISLEKKGNNFIFGVSLDNINFTYNNFVQADIQAGNKTISIGHDYYRACPNCAIYLNETIIYKNNKLWFNGQQA